MDNLLKYIVNTKVFCCHISMLLSGAAAMGLAAASHAATYVLPKSDVVGQIQYTEVKNSETLQEIARRYDVGINAIKAANPGIDPRAPKTGTRITIPTRHILPKGPRKGVVINMAELRLYHYTNPKYGPALVSTYPISIGPDGRSTPLGEYKIIKRTRKPTYVQSTSKSPKMLWEKEIDDSVIPSGPNNPLGQFLIQVSAPGYIIHGTNKPYSIGMRVGSGGVRLYPEDIEVLIQKVTVDTPVRIINERIKYGYKNGALYLELHKPENEKGKVNSAALVNMISKITNERLWSEDWRRIRIAADKAMALAVPVAQIKAKPPTPRAWWLSIASYKDYQTARNLVLKLEPLDIPLSINDCFAGKPCRVMAGPFTSRDYIYEAWKRVKWVTGIKGEAVPFSERDDLKLDANLFLAKAN